MSFDLSLPCPFCGTPDDIELGFSTKDREGTPCYLYCSTCGAVGPWKYVSDAETAYETALTEWNRRHKEE